MKHINQILVVLLAAPVILLVLAGRHNDIYMENGKMNTAQDPNLPADKFTDPNKCEKAAFAAGCFWHVQYDFDQVAGVVSTIVGYTGGTTKNPTYQQVCTGKTGYAEAVKIIYDPNKVSHEKLLDVFFENHNPTTKNRQGLDFGTQYRSAIFFHNPEQQKAALAKIDELTKSGRFKSPIVTEVKPAGPFYKAEDYHQKHVEKHGTLSCPAF